MRAALIEAWPDLSYHFDIHPWDVGRLSIAELNQYQRALNDINREARKAR